MKNIVISQPMFFPWVGLFEQIKIADCFVHYPDVALPRGRSFTNRVQVKGPDGTIWLTAPVKKVAGQLISEAQFDDQQNWREKHIKILKHFYAKAPFMEEMIAIVSTCYAELDQVSLSRFNIGAIEMICDYLDIDVEFASSEGLYKELRSTERLVAITRHFSGTVYVTGWGAKNYLDIAKFKEIDVHLMDYRLTPYQQLHGEFTPYVSILDLIANEGPDSKNYLRPRTVSWDTYLAQKDMDK